MNAGVGCARQLCECRRSSHSPRFLATKGDEIVGFVWTKIHQDFVNQEPVGELYVVGVDPDHAHQGIGRAVSVAAINYLVAKGLKHSMLYVDADNENGLALYTSLGFN